ASEAIREVRAAATPRQDPAGRIQAAWDPARQWRTRQRELRPAGLHALLGPVLEGVELGGQEEDGEEPLSARAAPHLGVVSSVPAHAHRRTAPAAFSDAARPRRLLLPRG